MHRLSFGLIGAALLLGCGGSQSASQKQPAPPQEPPRPAVSSDWREVLPANPQAVVGMNITRLSRSPLVEALVETIAAQDESTAKTLDMVREVGAECGMEVSRDLHSVVIGFYYGHTQPASAAVIKGSFDEARFADCATRMGQRMGSALLTTELSGYKVYKSPSDEETGVLCVPKANLMLVASDEATMQALLAGDTPRFGADRTELSALLVDLPQDRSLWGAGIIPQDSDIASLMVQNTGGALSQPARAAYGHAEIHDSIDARGGLVLASAQDAGLLLEWTNTQLAMLRPLLDAQGMGSLLDTLTVAAKGERLTASLALSAEQIQTIMSLAQ